MEKLKLYYKNNTIAHAYLVDTNNIIKCEQVLLNVIKNIFCVNEFNENCNKCSLCHLIDIDNLPSLKIIRPDGLNIKKEQILELKKFCSTVPLYTKTNIYIIVNAEKMNKESANTMLKFLEEPDANVIGFFITNNKNNIMPTIQSRCENIKCIFSENDIGKFNIDEEKYNELNNIKDNIIDTIEEKKINYINMINLNIKDFEKNDLIILFQMILDYYLDILDKSFSKRIYKICKLIVKSLDMMRYNINIELMVNNFFIEVEMINNESL